MRREVDVRIVDLRRATLEKFERAGRTHLGQQILERAAEDLRLRVAEDALAGGIEGLDVAGVVDRDDGVLDVVENGLQVRRALFADFARERLSLVRHELHGAHDAAPLRIDAVVLRAHRREEHVQVEIAPPSRLGQLALEQPVQALWGGRCLEGQPRYRVTRRGSPNSSEC